LGLSRTPKEYEDERGLKSGRKGMDMAFHQEVGEAEGGRRKQLVLLLLSKEKKCRGPNILRSQQRGELTSAARQWSLKKPANSFFTPPHHDKQRLNEIKKKGRRIKIRAYLGGGEQGKVSVRFKKKSKV